MISLSIWFPNLVRTSSWRRFIGAGIMLAGFSVGEIAIAQNTPGAKAPTAAPTLSAVKANTPSVEVQGKIVEFSTEAFAKATAPGGVLADILATPTDPKTYQGDVRAIIGAEQAETLLQTLYQTPGVDLVGAPRVTTRAGRRAKVEIVLPFKYATAWERSAETGKLLPTAFENKDTGVSLEAEPTLEADGTSIHLQAISKFVKFLGFQCVPTGLLVKATELPRSPIFDECKTDFSMSGLCSGQTVVVYQNAEELSLHKKQLPKNPIKIVFITVRILSPSEKAAEIPSKTKK